MRQGCCTSVASFLTDTRYASSLSLDPGILIVEVTKWISKLKIRFINLKHSIMECLEKNKVPVYKVADGLTSLSPDDDEHHIMFIESHVKDISTAENHSSIFGTMNLHWNYLDPSLLTHLVTGLGTVLGLEDITAEVESYESELMQFRMNTPLKVFCRCQKRKMIQLPPGFKKVVSEFNWPENVTMDIVEQFRQVYASHYKVHEFAMMLAEALPGSFIVTWFIPQSIVEKLKLNVPEDILKKYSVTKLTIAGTCVYRCLQKEEVYFKHLIALDCCLESFEFHAV